MRQRKNLSIQAITVTIFLIMLGGALAIVGLANTANLQGEQWLKILVALVSFGGGFLFIELEIRRVQRRFSESVAKQEQRQRRHLTLEEREKVKETMRVAMPDSSNSPGFGHPLIRIIARILIVTVPAVILLGVVASAGAFLVGLGLALLLSELTRRSFNHL